MTVPSRHAVAEPEYATRYRDALGRLFARRRFGLRPGLEVVRALLEELGDPQRRFPAIHVTGSKGKGSVATFAAAILSEHGLRTGLYTSPHLASYRERMRVDGRSPTVREVADRLERVEGAADRLVRDGRIDRPPTFFEVTTALAFDWFASRAVDAAVVEVGLGGRLDATNVLDSRAGVLTTIELEHTELLGPDLETIASEKAGIFRAGMTGVVGALPPPARAVVRRVADRLGVTLWELGREIRTGERGLSADGQWFSVELPRARLERVELPLFGSFQAGNTALAVAASSRFLEATGRALEKEATVRALAHVRFPGRMERVARGPELFFDVAHTPDSARAVAQSVAEVVPLADPQASAIVFGCLGDKRVDLMLDALAPLARTIVLVPVRSERSMDLGRMRLSATARFPRVVLAPTARDGLRLARSATSEDGVTLVTGSDYLVGELERAPDDRDEPDLSDPGLSSAPPDPVPSRPTTRSR